VGGICQRLKRLRDLKIHYPDPTFEKNHYKFGPGEPAKAAGKQWSGDTLLPQQHDHAPVATIITRKGDRSQWRG
jgi:hypothetical protein